MQKQIENYIKSGRAGLNIVTAEEQRVEALIKAVAKSCVKDGTPEFGVYVWSCTAGIINAETKEQLGKADPIEMLDGFMALPEKSILVCRDFHQFMADGNPLITRKVKDALLIGKQSNRVLIVVGCRMVLPPELEKEITVIDFKLPTREELQPVVEAIAASAGITLNGNRELILDALSGLTTNEAEDAASLSVVEAGDILPAILAREKSNTVRKNGLLEIVDQKVSLTDIGGLENIKTDLSSKRNLFTKAARQYGIPTPRGLLIVGQAGTGKSLCATATGDIFKIPLIRLEAGKLFGSLVGQSESNWRSAFGTVKAIAPCVLWIDEVDGLFSGHASSGQTDGGTTSRVIKAILQDMQYNGDGVFFCFTANDIDGLPDPLIDRLDVWSVDLPTQTERESIWKIHIAKRGRKPDAFDLPRLATASDGFSGRQIEQVWVKAMTLSFNDEMREPTNEDALNVLAQTVPTSVTMSEAIGRRRARLANRAHRILSRASRSLTKRKSD